MMEATSHLKYCYLFTILHSLISPEDGNQFQDCCKNLKSQIIYSPHCLSFFVSSNFVCWNDTLNQCTEACIHLNNPIWDVKYSHPLKFRCRNHEMFGICYECMYAVLLLESLVICGHQFCLQWYYPLFWRIWSEALKKESVWIQIIPSVATWFYCSVTLYLYLRLSTLILWTVSDELERTWMEVTMAELKYLPGICMDGWRKTVQTSLKIVDITAVIWAVCLL